MSSGDIIIGSAIAGVAGEVAKAIYRSTAQRWVDRYFDRHAPKAYAAAETNTVEFLARLASRLENLEGAAATDDQTIAGIQAALDEPDVAFAFRQAILAGARTSSRERHEILARVVAKRLTADLHSTKAVASNRAIEVVQGLSVVHLDVLGLLAAIHAVRPTHLIPPDVLDAEQRVDWSDEARTVGEAQALSYASWFREQIALYPLPLPPAEPILAHLSASSCLLVERKVRRKFIRAAWPRRRPGLGDVNTPFYSALSYHLGIVEHEFVDQNLRFSEIWEQDLQHGLPTPTGLILGLAVHDLKSGQQNAIAWEWSDEGPSPDMLIGDDVWDGVHINETFLEALDKEIKDRAERRVDPWHALDR